jgi:endonuclease-3
MTSEIRIREIAKLLRKTYGRPAPRRTPPVDELIRTILSQNTSDRNSVPAFLALKRRFGSWEKVIATPASSIASVIRHAGLADTKSRRIKSVLKDIESTNGRINLDKVSKLDAEAGLAYLMSFEGVGPKTASCVLLFSFGKPVMPVDTHIFRVSKRLGILPERANIEDAHRILTSTVPKDLIYELHLGIISHGRQTCRATGPECGSCVLYGVCSFDKKSCYKTGRPCR